MADPLETACSLVGRFQYHFGRVEQKIDQAVIKLLDLDDKAGPIVTGSVAFASKVNFVRTSAYQQGVNETDKEFAEKTCDDVFAINNVRQIVIHSSFEPHDGGVQFRRTVARDGRVRVDDQVWSGEKFSEHFSTMRKLETDLDKLIELIKPVEPIDWFMAWRDPHVESMITWAKEVISRHQPFGLWNMQLILFFPLEINRCPKSFRNVS